MAIDQLIGKHINVQNKNKKLGILIKKIRKKVFVIHIKFVIYTYLLLLKKKKIN